MIATWSQWENWPHSDFIHLHGGTGLRSLCVVRAFCRDSLLAEISYHLDEINTFYLGLSSFSPKGAQ